MRLMSVSLSGERGRSRCGVSSPARFLRECIWRGCGISDVPPLSGSAAAWMYVPNARKKRITGENFISDVGLGVGWAGASHRLSGGAYVYLLADTAY